MEDGRHHPALRGAPRIAKGKIHPVALSSWQLRSRRAIRERVRRPARCSGEPLRFLDAAEPPKRGWPRSPGSTRENTGIQDIVDKSHTAPGESGTKLWRRRMTRRRRHAFWFSRSWRSGHQALALSHLIDSSKVILKVEDIKEKCHHAIQIETNGLGCVVMFFDGILHAEGAGNPKNRAAKAGDSREPLRGVVRRRGQHAFSEEEQYRQRPQYHPLTRWLHFPHPVGLDDGPYP